MNKNSAVKKTLHKVPMDTKTTIKYYFPSHILLNKLENLKEMN